MRRLILMMTVIFPLAACGARVDLEAERAALRAADQAWSQSPPDLNLFMSYVADNAYTVLPDADILQGKSKIRTLWAGMFTNPGFALKWTVAHVEVALDGRTGYTLGTFELTLQDSAGQTLKRTGKYTTIWQKQPDGQWKVVADTAAFDSPLSAP